LKEGALWKRLRELDYEERKLLLQRSTPSSMPSTSKVSFGGALNGRALATAMRLDSTTSLKQAPVNECNRLCLLKKSSFLPNSQNLGDTKYLEN
jgi:hypothetical protein